MSLRAAWDSNREIACGRGLRLVDKPAGLACGATASVAPSATETLDAPLGFESQIGLTAGLSCLWAVPERASGLVALVPPRQSALRPLRFGVVVGLEGGHWPGSGRLGAEPALVFERLGRVGPRSLVRLWGEGPLERLLLRIRARCRVVGDEPRSPCATRLLLHVETVRGGVEARAPIPPELYSWLAGEAVRGPEHFEDALREGLPVRYALGARHQAHRLVSEQSGELAGVTVDRYGDFALLAVSSSAALQQAPSIAQCLMDYGARGVYLKRRVRADLRRVGSEELSVGAPLVGEPAEPELVLRLGALRAGVRLADGHSTGLFLDQRDNWFRFGGSCSGRSLLNLFCYTGLFTLAAAAAGARQTTSIDLSRGALRRAARNLELCGLSADHHRLLASDVERWLDRAARRGSRFERIVLDPPSFGSRGRREVLSLERDLQRLLEKALRCLEPRQGCLLCVNHQRSARGEELAQLAKQAAARVHPGVELEVRSWVGPWDCPTLPGVTPTKAVILRLDGA